VLTFLWRFFFTPPLIIRIKWQNISQQWCHSKTQPSCLLVQYVSYTWLPSELDFTYKFPRFLKNSFCIFFLIILCSLLIYMQTMKMKSTEFYLIFFKCGTRYQYMLDEQGLILGTNRDIVHSQYVCTYSEDHLHISLNIVYYRSWHEVVNIWIKIQSGTLCNHGSILSTGKKIFLSPASGPALGPKQPSTQWVTLAHSPG
jgi:hypothetical protein